MKPIFNTALSLAGAMLLTACASNEKVQGPSFGDRCISSLAAMQDLPSEVRNRKQISELDYCLSGPISSEEQVRLLTSKATVSLESNIGKTCLTDVPHLSDASLLDRGNSTGTVEQVYRLNSICDLQPSGDMHPGLRSLIAAGRNDGIYFK